MYIQQNKKSPIYEPVISDEHYVFHSGIDLENNPKKTIWLCFNVIYERGNFLDAIYANLVKYDGFGQEGCYWYYPDMNSPYPGDKFNGVKFEWGFDNPNYTVYVSEEVCFEYTKKACERFLELHPEQKYRDYLNNILDNWKPLNKTES